MIMLQKKGLLTQAVLASTLFVTPLVQATLVPAGSNAAPFTITANAPVDHLIEVPGGIAGTAAQITTAAAPAVTIENAAGPVGSLVIDANNVVYNLHAVQETGAFPAVDITSLLGGNVTVGVGSGISAAGAAATDGILVKTGAGSGAVILNAGTIQGGTLSAIHLNTAATSSIIANSGGGVITGDATNGTKATILVDVGGGLLTLNNTGIITQGKTALDTIQLNNAGGFNSINNFDGGVIQNLGGAAAGGNAINNTTAGTGTITNKGIIFVDTKSGHGIVTAVGAAMGSITNAGDIIVGTSFVGVGASGSAISLGANINGALSNSGLLSNSSATNGTVQVTAASTIAGGITNTGSIINSDANGNALSLNAAGSNITFNQNAGTVVGNVLLAPRDSAGGGNIFSMIGGVINGDVTATTAANTWTLDGGTINGNLFAGGAGDFFNFGGTTATNVVGAVNGGVGADTFNINSPGAGFLALNGNGGSDILNVNTTFAANGPINGVNTILVNIAGTVFTLNAPIIGMNTSLNIAAGATMIDNGDILNSSGDVNNNGLLVIAHNSNYLLDVAPGGTLTNASGSTLRITNGAFLNVKSVAGLAFDAKSGSNLNVNVAGILTPGGLVTGGQLLVNDHNALSTDFETGSLITPAFIGFLPAGTPLVVVQAVDAFGTITDNSTLVQPNSAVISFTKTDNFAAPNTTAIQLTTNRNSYSSLADSRGAEGVAAALDALAALPGGPASQGLLNLLASLDQLPTAEAVDEALESFAPPLNYGLVAGSHLGMDLVFDGVQDRLLDLHAMQHQRQHHRHRRHASNESPMQVASNGLNFGDPDGGVGAWARIMGAHLDQDSRDDTDGYKANGAGAAIGLDWGVNECFTLGLVGSYTKVNVKDKDDDAPKDASIKSWQGTAYTWLEFRHGIYLDGSFGIASNDYKTNRVINLVSASFDPLGALVETPIQTAAQGDFDGTQYGAQVDLGWAAVDCDSYYFAPFARLKWIHLKLDDYTEDGADDFNLVVNNSKINEFLGGIGFKLGTAVDSGDVQWVPELSAMIAYDFKNDGEQTTSSFLGGSAAFSTDGVKPGRTIFDLGLSLNANVGQCQTFTLKYNLELREDFVGNAAYLQYAYLWH